MRPADDPVPGIVRGRSGVGVEAGIDDSRIPVAESPEETVFLTFIIIHADIEIIISLQLIALDRAVDASARTRQIGGRKYLGSQQRDVLAGKGIKLALGNNRANGGSGERIVEGDAGNIREVAL